MVVINVIGSVKALVKFNIMSFLGNKGGVEKFRKVFNFW